MSRAMRKPKRPDRNRARILAAAQREFAERGLEGASMNAIAARTHTTRAMINYYFGGKEELYLSVLEDAYRGIREAEAKLDLEHLPPLAAMRRIVEHTFDYYLAHQNFVNLVVAENQARGRYLKRSRAMPSFNLSIIDTLRRVLARGQREGRFRRGLDAVGVHGMISALGLFNVANQYTFGHIFRRDMGVKGDVAGRRRMVVDAVLRYLQA